MTTHSKRYRSAKSRVPEKKAFPLPQAVELIKSLPGAKFDETINVSIKLNVDPKKSDQNIRGAINLPKGIGKSKRVVVFAEGDAAAKAREAGAIEVGSDDLAKKIEGGWLAFDVVVATPGMMKVVGKLGKVLGPTGMMPSPKSGTVTQDVVTAVKEFAAGKVEFRCDDHGNVHVPVGKKSFSANDLEANVGFLLQTLKSMRPSTVKGAFMEKAVVASCMGPSVKLEFTEDEA